MHHPIYSLKKKKSPPPPYFSLLPRTWERNFGIDPHLLQNNFAAIFVQRPKKKKRRRRLLCHKRDGRIRTVCDFFFFLQSCTALLGSNCTPLFFPSPTLTHTNKTQLMCFSPNSPVLFAQETTGVHEGSCKSS